MSIVWAIVGSVIYALTHVIKKIQKGQSFTTTKFVATLIVGAVIGIIFYTTGVKEITEQAVWTQLGAYAGLTAFVENIVKYIGRAIKQRKTGS